MTHDQQSQVHTTPETEAEIAAAKPVRQEEQGQQSRQETTYPAVDYGSCWYHEEAVKTGAK